MNEKSVRIRRKFDEMMRTSHPFAEEQQIDWMRRAFYAGALQAYVEITTDPNGEAALRAEIDEYHHYLREELRQMHMEDKQEDDKTVAHRLCQGCDQVEDCVRTEVQHSPEERRIFWLCVDCRKLDDGSAR